MDGSYWVVEFDGPEGPDFGCVYAFSASDAKRSAKRQYGNKNVRKAPEAVEFTWFHYEPLLVPSRKVNGKEVASLKDQFFAGGRIGCEASGLEIMFTPDLLPEALEIGEGDEDRTVYGSTAIRVKGRPDLDDFIEIEGLDDAHLIDRLSSEAARIVGKSRLPDAPRDGRTDSQFPDRKPGERIETYERLVAAVRKFAAQDLRGSVLASIPGETDDDAERRLAALPPDLSAHLRRLDRLAPFERTPDEGVWETLVVDAFDGKAWIGVVNAAGQKDRVTTFGAEPDCSFQFDQWCLCREDSPMGDTPWDEARKKRRVVMYAGEPTVIDRGANYVTDVLTGAGCRVHFTCEGHPHSAYVGFSGPAQAEMAEDFRRAGWKVEEGKNSVTARMPEVSNVAERDAQWRKLSMHFSPESTVLPSKP